jgi:hypothetical protein
LCSTMKISWVKSKNVKSINICYHVNGRGKLTNKMFGKTEFKQAMDYCLSIIDDFYISTCTNDIKDWCYANNHDILRKKSWIFA